jgi:hypothetical protein
VLPSPCVDYVPLCVFASAFSGQRGRVREEGGLRENGSLHSGCFFRPLAAGVDTCITVQVAAF